MEIPSLLIPENALQYALRKKSCNRKLSLVTTEHMANLVFNK